MAAYAALSSLSETTELLLHILQKATDDGDGVHNRSSRNLLLQQLETEIESLRENADFLRSVLEKSPTHPFEAQMKDASEQARVIIERFVLDQLRSRLTFDEATLGSLSHQLRRIHEDLLSSMVDKIRNNIISESDQESVGIFDSCSLRQNTVTSADTAVVTDELRERLFGLFFDETSTELRVVSIVGMGGIGKTYLASWFYGYAISGRHLFHVIGWVTVSRDFSTRDILEALMESIQPFVSKPKQSTESIENYVHNNLKGRRFFIVLDNVWSPEALRTLMRTIPDDGNRSAIMITTRQDEVAVEANPEKPAHTVAMRLRTPDESYDLLQAKVFGDQGCPPDELRPLLRSIAMACDGLPLALALVAGILHTSNQSLREYRYILEKLSVEYNSRHEMVDAILALSYIHLPHRLRSCLLYMGAFREHSLIYVGRLTKQLSAQCFMHKSTIHEVQQCLEYIVGRSLLSVGTWKPDLRVRSVFMHDMVRDFCIKKAREEKFLHCVTDDDDSDHDLTGSEIKVSYNLDNLKRICNSDDADYDTHTIICFGSGWTRRRSPISVGRFRLLKSLDLPNVEVESFPNEVLNLFLLRLLVLGHVPELPQSISNLTYLETLIINTTTDGISSLSPIITLPRILCVPSEIWTMSQLRHIISFCCGALPPCPNKEENPPLQNLETLSAVMNLDCSEDLIRMIPNVKKLGIFYFGVERGTHSIENIERLSRLEKLKVWVMVPFSAPQNLNLGFPTTLRRLTLRGLRLSHRDLLVISRLPDLQALKLRRVDFEGDEWRITTTHDVFEKLEFLVLEELCDLRSWFPDSDDGSLFPMLHTLIIRTCKKLSEIVKVVRNSPSIDGIVIWRCNKSLVESAKRIRQSNENISVFIR